MNMKHWWNDTDRRKQKYWQKNLSQSHFVGFRFGNLLFLNYLAMFLSADGAITANCLGALREPWAEHLNKT
jgi:hypothetical protein